MLKLTVTVAHVEKSQLHSDAYLKFANITQHEVVLMLDKVRLSVSAKPLNVLN